MTDEVEITVLGITIKGSPEATAIAAFKITELSAGRSPQQAGPPTNPAPAGAKDSTAPAERGPGSARVYGYHAAFLLEAEERLRRFLDQDSPFDFRTIDAIEVWAGKRIPTHAKSGERNNEYHRAWKYVHPLIRRIATEQGRSLEKYRSGRGSALRLDNVPVQLIPTSKPGPLDK